MKRIVHVCVALVMVAVGSATRPAGAQDPSANLRHYRVVPRFSTVHQTGGIAGFDIRWRLAGWYDLQQGLPTTTNTGSARAKFVNADIWGNPISDGPVPAIVLDVDEVLNLERLKGESLPVAAPFDVYRFTGETAEGSPINLFASVIGPWMYVRGGTQPPTSSADMFQYQIRMLARSRPFADFNDDGRVDTADFVLARNANADGVTIASIADWRQQFGESVPDIAAMDAQLSSAVGSGSAIPEPTSLTLLAICTLLTCRRMRRV